VRRPRRPERPEAAEADERAVRTAALALLAGRDFARRELAVRLLRKGYREDLVESVLEGLQAEQLLSDARFAEQFAVQRAARGKGPARIRQELAGRGVSSELTDKALDVSEEEWVRRAREIRRKRFGEVLPSDFRERAKQARFLQYRGFSAQQIRAALGPGDDFES
jgi:regulatory protein